MNLLDAADRSIVFFGEICFSRTAEIVVYTCSILGLPPEVVYRGNAGIAQLVEQLICNSREAFCAGFRRVAHRCGR